MSKNKDDVDIGFDPLAWMNDTETAEEPETNAATVTATESITQELTTADVDETVIAEVAEQPEVENAAAETVTPAASGETFTVNLAGKVDIASAEQLKIELSDSLNQGGPVILAAGDVERADGAGLQLLTAFIRKIENLDRELIWEEPSEQLIMAANIVGLKEALRLP